MTELEPPRPTTELLDDCAPSPERLRLVVRGGGGELVLEQGTYRVGKDPSCDLVLDDAAVSREHLAIEVMASGVRLRDLQSTNGSFLQGARFFDAVEARPGATVRVGKTELQLLPAGPDARALAPSLSTAFGALRGHSLPMRRLFALLERLAPAEAPLLVQGETGTGKELCAEALHAHSARASKPFVVVDLAAISPTLIESELFGHVRGAFTGAVSDRAGAFERADGGTVFLDEVGELSSELQPRLLRALERGQIKRVGGNEYKTVNVRVVAATHRDLLAMTAEGRFREDLYHRLAVLTVRMPALRERREDIPDLVEAFLERLQRPGAIGEATLAHLVAHDWPGNVRELRNVVERAVSLAAPGEEVPAGLLALPREASARPPSGGNAALPFKEAKDALIEHFEREYLEGLLARCAGNVSRAAREAGIDRVYLHRLLKRYALTREPA
jgi:two-component system nitrogen regulation response regulator GlnG